MKVLVKEIKEVGLEINIEKAKYLPISRYHVGPRAIAMDGVTLKKIEDFKYFEGLLNERNTMVQFSGGEKKSKLLSRTSKVRIYKTIIQPVVLYGVEQWT
ncbi:hypothetical protein PR048_026652 [Dryococelus australis]|uniref:Reverse transcriptase n=1 Tax=Dryococelus australis TaxID=614101 RepID=A0ABQ9GLY5_9NEOP|nr:hypothetical protein PR048_026652 [Dryococelus australis]